MLGALDALCRQAGRRGHRHPDPSRTAGGAGSAGNPAAPPPRGRAPADRPAGGRGTPHRTGRQEPGRSAVGPAAHQQRTGAPAHRRSRRSRAAHRAERPAATAAAALHRRGPGCRADRRRTGAGSFAASSPSCPTVSTTRRGRPPRPTSPRSRSGTGRPGCARPLTGCWHCCTPTATIRMPSGPTAAI